MFVINRLKSATVLLMLGLIPLCSAFNLNLSGKKTGADNQSPFIVVLGIAQDGGILMRVAKRLVAENITKAKKSAIMYPALL